MSTRRNKEGFIDKGNRNYFFDRINDYIPDITKEDFYKIYKLYRSLWNDHGRAYMSAEKMKTVQKKVFALLDDYKRTEWVITNEELKDLIKFMEDFREASVM